MLTAKGGPAGDWASPGPETRGTGRRGGTPDQVLLMIYFDPTKEDYDTHDHIFLNNQNLEECEART